MKNRLLSGLAAMLTASIFSLPVNCFAANTVVFTGAGSSAMFNAFAVAAHTLSGANNNYSIKGKATVNDVRPSGTPIPQTGGNIWVVWDGAPANSRTIWCFIAVDSVVGVRAYFAAPKAQLGVDASVQVTPGANLVPGLPLDAAALPADVFASINNQPFNAALTDIRPEDAKFATARALAALTTNRNGLGYGPGPVGSAIHSAVSAAAVVPVDFNITGTDPITGQPVPAYATSSVGAAPVVVFVNKSNTAPFGFGSIDAAGKPRFQNVDRFVLTGLLNGSWSRTRDLIPNGGGPAVPTTTFLREPLSGTYNTLEFCIPRSVEGASSQEIGVDPAVDNPLNQTYVTGGKRLRVIGTGEMISTVNSTTDSLGYAFWSFPNFDPTKVGNTKYLTVDGVDPLQNTYPSTGAYPTTSTITFKSVKDGSYPIWSVLRVVTTTPVPAAISQLITTAKVSSPTPDFVPTSQLSVFRSHYTQAGIAPNNGIFGTERGGDMGGAVYTVNAESDYHATTGKSLVNHLQ